MNDRVDCLVLEGPRRLVQRSFRRPTVGERDAVLRVEACGLCGTDYELFTGDLPWPVSFVPGHETVGIIEEIGPAASERWGVRAGDRVAVASRRACRACEPCRRHEFASCVTYAGTSSYGLVSVDVEPSLWGGYATHHYLAYDSVVHAVPVGLDPLQATLFNPLGAGMAWGVDLPSTKPGDVVAVLGPGIRGIAAAMSAKAAGASFVMVTGFGPRDADRLAVARQLGADLAVDVATVDPVQALEESTGGRLANVVVDVTAKAPEAFAQALALAARAGRVVIAGVRGGEITLRFSPDLITNRGLTITGASGVSTSAHRRALELLASGAFPIDEVPERTAGFADLDQLLILMAGEGGAAPPLHAVFVPDQVARPTSVGSTTTATSTSPTGART